MLMFTNMNFIHTEYVNWCEHINIWFPFFLKWIYHDFLIYLIFLPVVKELVLWYSPRAIRFSWQIQKCLVVKIAAFHLFFHDEAWWWCRSCLLSMLEILPSFDEETTHMSDESLTCSLPLENIHSLLQSLDTTISFRRMLSCISITCSRAFLYVISF